MEVNPSKVNLSEKDIEDWLYENPEELTVCYHKVTGWIGRQVKLPSGIADLVGYIDIKLGDKKQRVLIVVEVKNVDITSAALTQVCRYSADIKNALSDFYTNPECPVEYVDDPYVYKAVVFRGGVPEQIVFEANALDVNLVSFEVTYELKLSGQWGWTESRRKEIREEISEIADRFLHSELFVLEDEEDEEDEETETEKVELVAVIAGD